MFSRPGLADSPKYLPDIIVQWTTVVQFNMGIRKALAWKSQPNFINLKK